MRIVQMSDIHTGTPLFRPELMEAAIEETNAFAPDLVAVAGDPLTDGRDLMRVARVWRRGRLVFG